MGKLSTLYNIVWYHPLIMEAAMSRFNCTVTYNESYATLSSQVMGRYIPLVSSTDILQVENIYDNILSGVYSNARELCKDIHNKFSTQATLIVLVTLV